MSKKKKCPEFENHERWLVSYADMLTLLFAVFVTLYALKEGGGEPQVKSAAGSLQESFSTPLEDIPIDRRIGPAEQGLGVFEHFKGDQIRPPLISKYPSERQRVHVIEEELSRFKFKLEERLYGPGKIREPEEKGFERVVSVERTAKGFKLSLLARHFFDSGLTTVRREALGDLDKVISLLKELGRAVTIEGHTDSLPAKGPMSNWEISTLRATGILRYMVRKHDFPQTLLSAVGYADLKPVAHNATEEGRALNRRVEIHIEFE